MTSFDNPKFKSTLSYQGWIELNGLRLFPGRDATRRYDRFYYARKGRKFMRVHHDAHHIAHERYSNGQTVHWLTERHSPHNSIYSQIKELLGVSGAIYYYTDLVHDERKRLKKRTRRGDEGILRRLGYVIGN